MSGTIGGREVLATAELAVRRQLALAGRERHAPQRAQSFAQLLVVALGRHSQAA